MYLHKHITANNISVESFPFQREIAMEAYLLENPSILSIETEGFNEVEIIESEVSLLDGRSDRGSDGRIDILAKYGQEYLAVVELKLGELTEAHLTQLESYLKERKQILEKFPNSWDNSIDHNPKWFGVMIGAKINPELMLKIRKGHYFENEIPIAALTINRYKGTDGNVYVVTDTYFIEKVKNRDYTKYIFDGQKFGKSRLVLAVIKDYVTKQPGISFNELQSEFPDKIQGREIFTTEIKAISKPDRRNFIQPDELIKLVDCTIAVSTQWGIVNIRKFIEHCKNKGINIATIV
jgi:ribosomal protein S8